MQKRTTILTLRLTGTEKKLLRRACRSYGSKLMLGPVSLSEYVRAVLVGAAVAELEPGPTKADEEKEQEKVTRAALG